MRPKSGENAGYTLVELLIAVTILAIVAVPLMHAFVSSARTNAKARKLSQATTAAWNVMEEIKAAPLEDILEASVQETELPEGREGPCFISYRYDYGKVTVDRRELTAEVLLSASAYTRTGEGVWDDIRFLSDEVTDYNQTALPHIYDMNPVCDASYLPETGEARRMAALFAGDEAIVQREMSREIILDISKEEEKTLVEVSSSYTWNGTTKRVSAQKQCIYSSKSEETQLRNIYVFFEPLPYPGTDAERIIIKNWDEIPVNVYLIRQGEMPDAATGYRVDVDVLESGREVHSYEQDGALKVYTHLRTNLIENPGTSDGTGSYPHMELRYGTQEGNYAGELTSVVDGAFINYTAQDLTELKGLAAEAAENRIYNVTVTIREKDENGNEKELVSVSGTKEK